MKLPSQTPLSPPEALLTDGHDAAILERISDGFLALDSDGRFSYVNANAAALFGRSREDLLGSPIRDGIPEGGGTPFQEACERAAREQVPVSFEAHSPGWGRWHETHVYPSAEGLSVFFRDITERREARRRLEESEQRYRSLFDKNADAVFTLDPEGRFVDVNAACETLTGYSQVEMRGAAHLPLVVPEDRERTQEITARALRGEAQHEQITILHKSGRRVTVEITKVPIVVDGAIVGIHGVAKDVTAQTLAEAALRDSEQRLRAVAEASPVATTVTRWHDARLLYANRHFRDLFGLAEGENLIGRRTTEFYADPADRELLLHALTARDFVPNWEVRCRRADGSTFWTSGSFQRLDYNGEAAVFSVYHDVTEGRRLLREAQEEAERDPLTGLLNHRAFFSRFEQEAARVQAGGGSLAVAVFDLDNFKFFNDVYGHASGDDVLRQAADALRAACRGGDAVARIGGDEFAALMPDIGAETGSGEVAARLEAALAGVGHRPPGHDRPIPVRLSAGVAVLPGDGPDPAAALGVAEERLRRAKVGIASGEDARRMRLSWQEDIPDFAMLDGLVGAADARDRYTRRHSEEVMGMGLRLAQALGLDERVRRVLAAAALLHDVGRIGVPDSILRKPAALTLAEWEAVRRHPAMGATLVGTVPGLEETLPGVRHHHERWDGGGYPDGLAGAAIPLPARILAVADAWAAMRADRPYRKARTAAETLAELEAGAGTQWDPACVAALVKLETEV